MNAAAMSPSSRRSGRRTLSSSLGKLARKPAGLAAIGYLVLLLLVAIAAPLVWPDVMTARTGDLAAAKVPPGAEHWLGTDSLGRDNLIRLLVGTRVTLIAVAIALVVATVIGTVAGVVAGYLGGLADRILSAIANLMFSLPGIVLILLVLAVYPGSMAASMVTLGLLAAPGMMKIVRSAVLPVKAELYVAAAKTFGISDPRILIRHILPRVAGPIIVQASLMAALALVAQTGLAFLGLINEAPQPSWGGAVAEAAQNIISDPWMIWAPGLLIVITSLAFGVVGDTVRDLYGESRSRGSVMTRSRSSRSVGPTGPSRVERDPEALLDVRGLTVEHIGIDGSVVTIADGVTFAIRRGEALALVGESGCGKSVTSVALVRALPPELRVASGTALLDGVDLMSMDESGLGAVRGSRVGVVAQEPMSSLNPVFKVGQQVTEAIRQHRRIGRVEAKAESIELLRSVGLKDAKRVWDLYPHEVSGGMAQRVAIARALAGNPELLIADEPTTALDVTVQAEILQLLKRLREERDMALLLISHDWGVVAKVCERVAVMYAGQVVEIGRTEEIIGKPQHPYSRALIAANPYHAKPKERLATIPGVVPPPGSWPVGCHFARRCEHFVAGTCDAGPITLVSLDPGHSSRCARVSTLEAAAGGTEVDR